jgi:hypothetical protein
MVGICIPAKSAPDEQVQGVPCERFEKGGFAIKDRSEDSSLPPLTLRMRPDERQ